MDREKAAIGRRTEFLTFRASPGLWQAVNKLARTERRSLSRMAEILIEEALAQRGIGVAYDRNALPQEQPPSIRPMTAEVWRQRCLDFGATVDYDDAYCRTCGKMHGNVCT